MNTVLLPIHILYHDQLLDQPIRNQLSKLAGELAFDDSPIRISIVKMGVTLDALSDPKGLSQKLKGERNFRVELSGALDNILSNYNLLEDNGKRTIYSPEIVIFLKLLPTPEEVWRRSLSFLNAYNPTVGVYWINQTPLESGNKRDIEAILQSFCFSKATMKYKIIEEKQDLDFVVKQAFFSKDKLQDRIKFKLSEIQKLSDPKSVKSVGRQQANSNGNTKQPIMPPEKTSITSSNQQSPVKTIVSSKSNLDNANFETSGEAKVREGSTLLDGRKQTVPPNYPSKEMSNQISHNSVDNDTQQKGSQINGSEGPNKANALPSGDDEKGKPLPPKPSQPAEWHNIPPQDPKDPVTEFLKDSRAIDKHDWYIVGASARGKMHKHEGTYREDAMAIEQVADWSLVAVADGAGSHHLSRVGSNLAVKTAIAEMQKVVKLESPGEAAINLALSKALRSAWIALFKEAEKRQGDGVTFKDLSTTLLLLMYYPAKNLVGVAQVGDGLLAAQLDDGRIALLGKPESGEYSGQTYFLTNHNVDELASKVETPESPGPIKMFLIMTDGVADDFYPPQDPQKGLPLLIKYLPSVLDSQDPEADLLKLIDYPKAGSFDDRTLVIVCQRNKIGEKTTDVIADEKANDSTNQQIASGKMSEIPTSLDNGSNTAEGKTTDKPSQLVSTSFSDSVPTGD